MNTPNPKCRLYWCLIELLDWRYSPVMLEFSTPLLVFNIVYWLEIQSVMLEFSTHILVFNRVYRLEIQSVMLEFSTPLTFSLVHRVGPALHDNASSLCANLWLAILARGHLARTHSHKVIPPQRRLRMCKAAAPLTCRICPSYKHFAPIPCFVERVHTKPPVLREGTLVPSFLFT